LRILLLHNHYRQPGGEDTVFRAEHEILQEAGHSVTVYTRHNDEIRSSSLADKAALTLNTLWARDSFRDIHQLVAATRPDVAHFHNTFPLISPAAYYACERAGVPVIQTLHNPRLLCPAATLFREGRLCTDCLDKSFPWNGVLHGCYRESRAQTGLVATMLAAHRALQTWQKRVATYIVSTQFYRRLFIQGGLPEDKIAVKPHFVPIEPGPRSGDGEYALFVGRLAPEKGVPTLLSAWKSLPAIPLRIRGDGPLFAAAVDGAEKSQGSLQLVPRLAESELISLIKGARFLVWPSEGYYETFGLVAIEAFACGVPVIASRIGVMAEIVSDGRTGLHFAPGDAADLAAKVQWAWEHPSEMCDMGRASRAEYEAKYTPELNCKQLIGIYKDAIAGRVVERRPLSRVAEGEPERHASAKL
jgi:glycosyltransferase involved in cell wall biosynthesis